MGKPASSSLFVDSEHGRVYVCCPPCYKEVRADAAAAAQAAYPTVKPAANPRCPISNKELPDPPVLRVIQGIEVGYCCDDCADKGMARPQVTLALAMDANLREVRNSTCPITGEPAADNHIVRIGDDLIHLSSMKHLAAVERDPAGALAKAKQSADQSRREAEAKGSAAGGHG